MIFIIIYFLFPYLISSLLLQDGWTALMLASWKGHLEVVRTLLESGANVNAKNNVRKKSNDNDNNYITINYLDDNDDCYRCIYVNNR